MRKFSVLFVAVMVMFSGSALANDSKNEAKPVKKLSTQIGALLDGNSFVLDSNDLTAQVRFTLNDEGEIVVLSVSTENPILEGFVKGRLNYKKVELDSYKEGKIYTVPVRITAR
ncbi:MAG: hypothetical protein V7724_10475 [Sediminicola sp.]